MKKVFAIVLSALLLVSFAGCGEKKEDPNAKSEGVMTYAEYAAAALDSEVTVETYVQNKQSWWDGKATLYTQDGEGGYFIYNMAITEDEYNKLVPGTKLKIKGYKSEWSGEIEITDATYEIEEGSYIAEALDVTDQLGSDSLIDHQNMYVSFKGMTVESAAIYKWDGSGSQGDDLYFGVSCNGQSYTFVVESYLTGADTDVYKAVEGLKVGDVVDMTGYLYWYEGVQPHIISVTVNQ
jgi:hypothetical protein